MDDRPWFQSYVDGVPRTVDYEPLTVSEALTRAAARWPDAPAMYYMGTSISYAEFDRMVDRFGHALQRLGVEPGDRVALVLPNLPQTLIANMAVLRIGAVVVQNNPLYSERELGYQLKDSGSKLAITLSVLVPRVSKLMLETPVEKVIACQINAYLPLVKRMLFPYVRKAMYRKVTPSDQVLRFEDLMRSTPEGKLEDRSELGSLAVLIYTGGTTGRSKGVMLSHENLSKNVQQLDAWLPGLREGQEIILGSFPLFHSAGLGTHLYYIWNGFEHLIVPRPEPKGIVELLKKRRPTFLPGVPTLFVGLLADEEFRNMDLSFIRGFFSGAAPLAPDTLKDLLDRTGACMCEVYGLTETSPFATAGPYGGEVRPGTVGLPLPDTDVRIVDTDTGETDMAVGEEGEILIKGPQVMMGYYEKPEETDEALRDGWLYTGDIGRFDEQGYLQIVDRKKDMIIAGGYNIYPLEIDNVLMDHPDIVEACAVGLPDEYRGETVKAFVVAAEGSGLTADDVVAYCRDRLAAYKVPKMVELIDELPKSAVGKVLRRELRDRELAKRGD